MTVATAYEVLDLLSQGTKVIDIVESSKWPARRVHLLANRHGFLISEDGTPYKPPGKRETQGSRNPDD